MRSCAVMIMVIMMTSLKFEFNWLVICTGDGYCRSEAIVAIYLQKMESVKRVYATLVHSKTNSDGYKDNGNSLVFNFFALPADFLKHFFEPCSSM